MLAACRPNNMRTVLLLVLALPAFAQTVVNDKPAAARLLGTHPLSLQWVTFDTTKGEVTITDSAGVYKLKGQQKGKDNNFLTIEGEVLQINAKDFLFQGRIVTRVSYIAGGKECARDHCCPN